MAHRFQSPSSYLKEVTENSQLIGEGPPALYRLTTTRSDLVEDGKVRKWTFGQRVLHQPNKTLLIVGETGTGKTSLINAMANYALGVKFEDNVWFCITEERDDAQTSDQTASQTVEITVYEIFGQDCPFSLTIIDTPGYGDTRGAHYDKQIATNLYRLFLNDTGVKEIDAVCLVVKAGMNRLSERQHYIFDAVLSLFGKDVENNIVICVTHSDGGPPTNALKAVMKAKIPCRKNSRNKPVHFLLNNRDIREMDSEYEDVYLSAWNLTEKALKDLFSSLKDHNKISIDQTRDVLEKHIQLTACISSLFDQIQFTEEKKRELTQIQGILNENKERIKKSENFTFTITTSYKEKVHTDNKVTTCPVCENNCHLECTMAFSPWWCAVMSWSGNCTVCNCFHNKHERGYNKYEIKTTSKQLTYMELQEQFKNKPKPISVQSKFEKVKEERENTMKERWEKMSTMDKVTEEIKDKEKEKTELLEDACNTILKLCEIALKTDSAFIMKSLDFLISQKEQDGEDEWVQKLKDLRKTEPEVETVIQIVRSYMGAKISGFASFVYSSKNT